MANRNLRSNVQRNCPVCLTAPIAPTQDCCPSCVCISCRQRIPISLSGSYTSLCEHCACTVCKVNSRIGPNNTFCVACVPDGVKVILSHARPQLPDLGPEQKLSKREMEKAKAESFVAGPNVVPDPAWQIETLSSSGHKNVVHPAGSGKWMFRYLNPSTTERIDRDVRRHPDSDETDDNDEGLEIECPEPSRTLSESDPGPSEPQRGGDDGSSSHAAVGLDAPWVDDEMLNPDPYGDPPEFYGIGSNSGFWGSDE